VTGLFSVWRRCEFRSVGHDPFGRSLLLSTRALPVEKNPASRHL